MTHLSVIRTQLLLTYGGASPVLDQCFRGGKEKPNYAADFMTKQLGMYEEKWPGLFDGRYWPKVPCTGTKEKPNPAR